VVGRNYIKYEYQKCTYLWTEIWSVAIKLIGPRAFRLVMMMVVAVVVAPFFAVIDATSGQSKPSGSLGNSNGRGRCSAELESYGRGRCSDGRGQSSDRCGRSSAWFAQQLSYDIEKHNRIPASSLKHTYVDVHGDVCILIEN
jgi:hypothetical protein